MTTFPEVFKAAKGYDPYPYQVAFATRNDLRSLLSVPTGCGKTAAVILGWLWRRWFASPKVREAGDHRVFAPSAAGVNWLSVPVECRCRPVGFRVEEAGPAYRVRRLRRASGR